MHRPELALRAGRPRRLRGRDGVGVLRQREVVEDELDLAGFDIVLVDPRLDRLEGGAAGRALEIAELDHRHRRVGLPFVPVAIRRLPDRRVQRAHRLVDRDIARRERCALLGADDQRDDADDDDQTEDGIEDRQRRATWRRGGRTTIDRGATHLPVPGLWLFQWFECGHYLSRGEARLRARINRPGG